MGTTATATHKKNWYLVTSRRPMSKPSVAVERRVAARLRRRAATLLSTATLGLLIGLLLVTKYQFFLCVAVAVVPMFALRRQTVARWASLIAPSVPLGTVQAWVAYGGSRQIVSTAPPSGSVTQWNIAEFTTAASQGVPALARFVTVEVVT